MNVRKIIGLATLIVLLLMVNISQAAIVFSDNNFYHEILAQKEFASNVLPIESNDKFEFSEWDKFKQQKQECAPYTEGLQDYFKCLLNH